MPDFFDKARAELNRARKINPEAFVCAHHGYAILLEEVDELWAEVKKKPYQRDREEMLEECLQIAAMAGRIAEDLRLDKGGDRND